MALKRGENVLLWRVSRLHSLAWNDKNLRLVCETKPFLNRTCWTHETSMHQFHEDSESQMRTLNMEVTFWSTGQHMSSGFNLAVIRSWPVLHFHPRKRAC